MKKKLSFLMLIMALCINIKAQEDCSNIPFADGVNAFIAPQATTRDDVTIKLYYHLYYNDDGENGVPSNRPNEMTALLNEQFMGTGISFVHLNCETIRVYNDALDESIDMCDFFFQSSSHFDGIDIHVKGDNNISRAVAAGVVSKELLLSGTRIPDVPRSLTSTLVHEMGHCLGLFHTHHGTCTESSFNCISGNTTSDPNQSPENGDYVEDTTPDPNLFFDLVNEDCEYVGAPVCDVMEIYGPYDPDTDNFMSYSRITCRTKFTEGQVARMDALMPPEIIAGNITESCCETVLDVTYSNDFTIDIPMSFGGDVIVEDGATLTIRNVVEFGEYRKLIIKSGATVLIDSPLALLKKCPEAIRWEGIEVEAGGTLLVTEGKIYSAYYGVHALSGSSVNLHDLFIAGSGSISVNSQIGVFLDEEVDVLNFNSVTVTHYNTGLLVKDNPNYVVYRDLDVSSSNNGVRLEHSSGALINGNYQFVGTPIYLTQSHGTIISYNTMKFSNFGIDANNSMGLFIEYNTIGQPQDNQVGIGGIRALAVSASNIEFNSIYAERVGIRAIHPNLTIQHNHDIRVKGEVNTNSGGIQLIGGNSCRILDNTIIANESAFGIESNSGTNHEIQNNFVSVSSNPNLFRAAAIKSDGSMGEIIKQNETYSSDNANGIQAQNTIVGEYECNYIYDTHDALGILNNSASHVLRTNQMLNSHSTDMTLRSMIGIQIHEGNEFWGDNARAFMSLAEVLGSQFRANPSISYHFPTDVNQDDWFIPESQSPQTCNGNVGPGVIFFNNPTILCSYFNNIKGLQVSNPKLFYVKLAHILKYYRSKSNLSLPTCISDDPILNEICGIEHMVDAIVEISDIVMIDNTRTDLSDDVIAMKTLQNEYVNASNDFDKASAIDRLHLALSESKTDLETEYSADKLTLLNAEQKLDEIQCNDNISQIWKAVWKEYINLLKRDDLEPDGTYATSFISSLCSDEFGEAVHLSRAMAGIFGDTTYYDVYDGCRDDDYVIAPRSLIDSNIEITVFPNPSNGFSNISFTHPISGKLEVLDAKGELVNSEVIDNETNIEVSLNTSGVYIVRIVTDENIEFTEKMIVIK